MPRVKGERGAPPEKLVRKVAAVAGWEEQRRRWFACEAPKDFDETYELTPEKVQALF